MTRHLAEFFRLLILLQFESVRLGVLLRQMLFIHQLYHLVTLLDRETGKIGWIVYRHQAAQSQQLHTLMSVNKQEPVEPGDAPRLVLDTEK